MTDTGPLDNASPPLVAALAVRFVLELALLLGVAVLAWTLTAGGWRWVAALVAVAVVATVWGLLLSPKARFPLPGAAALALEGLLFLGTGTGLLLVGFGVWAVAGCVLWILDRVAIAVLRN